MPRDANIAGSTEVRPALDAQLRRYHRSYRRRLRKFARSSDRLKDLVYAFPAAAFTLAAGTCNPLLRGEATRLVKGGASLKEVSKTLGLPNWTRRLPPEAFSEALGGLPDGDAFARRVVNLIPKEAAHTANWLQWVQRGNVLCDETFALWLAGRKSWGDVDVDAASILPLAAFAWYSRAEGTTARGLIEYPWTPQSGFGKSVEAARDWFMRCLCQYCKDDSGHTGRWFVAQKCSGFRIVPLRTAEELRDEGRRMDHCVGDYASVVASGACLIYSIRRGNKHVATAEIRPHWDRSAPPVIAQLRGPENDDVGEDISRALSQWLSRQGRYPFELGGQIGGVPFNEQRWAALWAPYQDAKCDRRLHVPPLALHRALENLSRLA